MNRLTESRYLADNPGTATRNPVSILLVARPDNHLDEVVKLISARDSFHLLACIDPQQDWHTRLPEQTMDILLVQKSVIAPAKSCSHTQIAETVFSTLQQRFPSLRIMVFGRSMDHVFVRRMLRLGVQGLIDSSVTGHELLASAIDEVHSGGYWIARNALEKLVHSALEIEHIIERGFLEQIAAMQDGLTRREAEVLERVLEGMSTRQIASQLFLSEQGVKMHLGRLFKKFGVANRAQLIVRAFQRACPFNHNMVNYFRQSREQRDATRH